MRRAPAFAWGSLFVSSSILVGGGELLGTVNVLWNVGDTWNLGLTGFWGERRARQRQKQRRGFGVGTVLGEKRVSPLRSSQTANCCGRNDRFWVGERTGNGND